MYKNRDQEMSSEKLQCRQILCRDSLELLRPDMKTLLWLLSAVLSLQCVTSQISMLESGPGIVRPSETLDLTCKVTGASLTDSTNMHCVEWIRQPEGKGLEWLGRICYDNTINYAQSVQGRITITRDTNKGEVYGKLTGVKPEESGKYYCARYSELVTGYFDIWGPGTLVTVTSVQIIIPAVYPVIAVGYTGSTSTSIACLVNRYWPPPVSVTWDTTEGEKLSEVKDIKFPLSGDLPAYNLLSQVTINKNDWDSKTYQCNVSFYSTNIVKIIPKVCDPLPEAPSVHLLQGTCPESNGEIELTCQVYNLTSQDATLKWYINDQERRFAEDKLELGKSKNHYFALHSTVTISQSEWNNGVPVKCQVTDTNTKTTAEDTIKKCSDSFNCLAIDVFVVKPSIEDLYVHKTARITCVASNLKDTNENYSFEWSFPGGSNLNIQTEDSQLHNNGTYSVSSVLTVSPDVWLQETEFTCVFRHNGLQKPIISRLKKEKVTKTSQPVVSMFPPSAEELAQKETYTLLCLSSKFNPQNIFMGWTENDLEVSKDLYVNSESMLETGGKTYFMTSKLTIPASSWDSGFSYGCVVGHETMPNNFYRTSFDKNSGKPSVVNVSVVMSDVTLSCY